ncbi:MAG: hypothetical protein E6G41_11570 [Actinobacteria bacterium]|nr:MAG: hypothetical protein E6G41_11570 [Actinomycetota bacterium]
MAAALLLISRLLVPRDPCDDLRIRDAREALGYWSRRAVELPWYRRAARREARALAAAARSRLIAAHLQRLRLGRVEHMIAPLLDTRGRGPGADARSLVVASVRRTAIGRLLLISTAALAAASIACLVVAVELAIYLAGTI